MKETWLVLVWLGGMGIASAQAAELPPAAQGKIDFESQIQPIFVAHCADCHGADTQEGKFRLDRKSSLIRGGDSGEPAILPGNSAESHLIQLVTGGDSGLVMPPDGAERLTSEEVGLLRAWIDQGADWPGPNGVLEEVRITTDHWSFQPRRDVTPPDLTEAGIQNPIDAFVRSELRRQKLTHNPPADRRTLIRRMYLDVLGLPPTPEQVQVYVDDPSPLATETLIEQVLASPHYGERQARYWLDLVRFAETHGFETNQERRNAWRYRDYVIESFNDDKPYDQFVKEQLAGDAVGDPRGLGYLVAGAYDVVKSPDINLTLMQRHNELDDMINTTGTAFLGLTFGCARCHNHKFDPITQADYYSLEAIFAGVEHGDLQLSLTAEQEAQARQLADKIDDLQRQLDLVPRPQSGSRILVIDDDPAASQGVVELLQPIRGYGVNPEGTRRGEKSDPGSRRQLPNLSGGQYTWWANRPGVAVMSWAPRVAGEFHLWLSWGSGYATHSQDARYVIDRDGDPATVDDWDEIAVVDQQQFAGGKEARLPRRPLWSGLHSVGVVALEAHQKILLIGGQTGTALTADVLVLEGLAPGEGPSRRDWPRFRDPVQATGNVEWFAPIPARFVRFVVEATNSNEPCLDEIEIFSADRNVALASAGSRATASGSLAGYSIHKLEHIHDGRFGNSWSWISNESGSGWVQIEFAEVEVIDRLAWARDREGRFGDRLPTRYSIEASLDGQQWQKVAGSEGRLPLINPRRVLFPSSFSHLSREQAGAALQLQDDLDAARQRHGRLTAPPVIYAGRYSQPGPTHRLFRGEPLMKREQVSPDVPAVFTRLNLSSETPEQQRRVALAEWIAAPDHPLTARVIVNRLWQHHFGRGLVDTASDFGISGTAPTHPELLDWLANELVANQWSLKAIHRLILNSATYQQASKPQPEGLAIDADARLLWRFPPRRLEAEPIRDAMLAVTGVLDRSSGGPGFSLFDVGTETVRSFIPKTTFGPAEWRRMIYMTKVRMEQDSVFGAFDCPDAGTSVPRRTVSTTPLQALNLFNSSFVLQQADLLAERLQSEFPDDLPMQVQRAYQLCYSRSMTAPEQTAAIEFVKETSLSAFCRAVLNSNEFLFLD